MWESRSLTRQPDFFSNICDFLVPPFTKMGTTGARRQGNRKPEKYNPVITC